MSNAGSNICQDGSAYLLTPHWEHKSTSGWTSQRQHYQQTNERIDATQNIVTMTKWHGPSEGDPAHARCASVQLCIYTLLQMHSSPKRRSGRVAPRGATPHPTYPATRVPFHSPASRAVAPNTQISPTHAPAVCTSGLGSAAVSDTPSARTVARRARAFLSEPTHGSYKP